METLPFREGFRQACSLDKAGPTVSLVPDRPSTGYSGLAAKAPALPARQDYGSRDCLAGLMLVDPLPDPLDPESTLGAKIFFEAGARTKWHRSPAQTLIVISGRGRMQRDGGLVEEIAAGMVVPIPFGEKIWFGAAATRPVTYIVLHGETR